MVGRFLLALKTGTTRWNLGTLEPAVGLESRLLNYIIQDLVKHDFLPPAKEPKKAWNSDDEDVDEFGRKKRRGEGSSRKTHLCDESDWEKLRMWRGYHTL